MFDLPKTQPKITNAMLVADANDAFRKSFSLIARHAVPYMAADSYFSDLLHDAAIAADMVEGAQFYLMVRAYGTNAFSSRHDAINHCIGDGADGLAVLCIKRHRFDRFQVDVVYERPQAR